MARKPRIHLSGAFYHVILRGNNRNKIFFSDLDREYFYSLIEEGVKRYSYRIHGFCLMSNHIHLVIQVSDVSLSKIMQHLSFRYTHYINVSQKKIGHLFQGRFKAILVDADNYLLELVRYIHANPVRAKMVDKIEDYLWSSHRAYLGMQDIFWLTKDHVLSYFNNALSSYGQFMGRNSDKITQGQFEKGNQLNTNVLANDAFMLKLKGVPNIVFNSAVDLRKIEDIICSYYFIDPIQLKNNKKSSAHTKIRAIIAWLAKEFSICTFNKAAFYFNRDATGIIRVIRRLEDSPESKQELEEFKKIIEKSVCQA